MTFYVDMDGVLVNFNKTASEILGMDFHLANNTEAWNKLSKVYDLYLNLEPLDDAFLLWESIQHLKPKILTAIPSKVNMPQSIQHKKLWIEKYFGTHIEVLYGPHSADKQNHTKPGDILIDDNPLNIKQWKSKQGIAILHTNTKDTIIQLKELKII